MDEAEFKQYFSDIESYFALKRGQILLLSPEEYTVIRDFYDRHVELKIIFKGIDIFFDKKKKRKRNIERTYFLTHIVKDIECVVEDYRKKGLGSYLAEGPSETEFIKEKLSQIINRLSEVDKDSLMIAEIIKGPLIQLMENGCDNSMDEIECELEKISMLATDKIFDILDDGIKNKVDEEIESIAGRLGKTLNPDIINRFRVDTVFDLLNFPKITLFS